MRKEVSLRLDNIASKFSLRFPSKTSVRRKKDKWKLEVARIKSHLLFYESNLTRQIIDCINKKHP
jgi:hypothetical protein